MMTMKFALAITYTVMFNMEVFYSLLFFSFDRWRPRGSSVSLSPKMWWRTVDNEVEDSGGKLDYVC